METKIIILADSSSILTEYMYLLASTMLLLIVCQLYLKKEKVRLISITVVESLLKHFTHIYYFIHNNLSDSYNLYSSGMNLT